MVAGEDMSPTALLGFPGLREHTFAQPLSLERLLPYVVAISAYITVP